MEVTIPVWALNALPVVGMIFGYIFVTAIFYSIARKIEGGTETDITDSALWLAWPFIIAIQLLAMTIQGLSWLMYRPKKKEYLNLKEFSKVMKWDEPTDEQKYG